jgi:hypothetical protein
MHQFSAATPVALTWDGITLERWSDEIGSATPLSARHGIE